jgi:hypothetical protein
MCPWTVFDWLRTNEQSLAIWLEGLALVAIFFLELKEYKRQGRERKEQHEESAAQMKIMQSQADAAKEAAEAAKANAEAARLNAQVALDTERPLIVMSVESLKGAPGVFVFRATNKGRTPAEFESGDATFCFRTLPDNLAVPPVYHAPFVSPAQALLTQNEGFDISPDGVNPESMIDAAPGMREQTGMSNQFLFFYGRVIYKDVFSKEGRQQVRYETRWCYNYDVFRRQFIRTGPDEYNRFT